MEHTSILNLSELEYLQRPAAMGQAPEGFDAEMAFIGPKIGGKLLGSSVTKVPPGKRAFPFHNHHVNEELFYILEGAGEVRIGAQRYPVKQGDFIACPPGGPESAHQIINTGETEMKYLGVSTKISPEIADYPDTGKFGVLADFGPDTKGNPQTFRFLGKPEQSLSYWEGEEAK